MKKIWKIHWTFSVLVCFSELKSDLRIDKFHLFIQLVRFFFFFSLSVPYQCRGCYGIFIMRRNSAEMLLVLYYVITIITTADIVLYYWRCYVIKRNAQRWSGEINDTRVCFRRGTIVIHGRTTVNTLGHSDR